MMSFFLQGGIEMEKELSRKILCLKMRNDKSFILILSCEHFISREKYKNGFFLSMFDPK